MAFQQKRESFEREEEEETLSLSDFPVCSGKDDRTCKSDDNAAEEFEFQISAAGGLLASAADIEMCAADEVFFQGQILPLRPSVSSDSGFLSHGASRRSESLDQYYSSGILGMGFQSTSRSTSSSSSRSSSNGSGMSRSHSSNSHCSNSSSNFYARPSPTPRIRTQRKINAGRKSASSAPPGWGIFRLGIAKAPEIELHDIMSRRPSNGARGSGVSARKSHAEAPDHSKKEKSSHSKNDEARGAKAVQKKPAAGRGLICRCSPEAVEPVAVLPRKKKEAETRQKASALNGRGDQLRRQQQQGANHQEHASF
ncbi:uncharacterized protein LOC121975476 [Zingiber officinale]|uniref:Uncharacterized protein n=1 Tax=Zingiber officinale TaxID=94328 RepID=A0A8J5GNW8_ZINOF|nr:uncharacterized protein LOC121975476 [Zingiber officinale]KAG6510995.1 hypothetical protein ZIOFF_029044 [Zingiber officinale]